MAFSLSETQKKWGRRIGYPLFGLLAFLIFIYATLPLRRFADMAEGAASAAGYDLKIGEISRGIIPGHATLSKVELTTRVTQPNQRAIHLTIDTIDLNVGLWKLMSGNLDVKFAATMDDGRLDGRFQQSKTLQSIHAKAHDVPLDAIPGLSQNLGNLPLAGGFGLDLDLQIPLEKVMGRIESRWSKASGSIGLRCDHDCTIGDEKSLTGTPVRLGPMPGSLTISKGVATFKNFKTQSPDGELEIVGRIEFHDPINTSEVKICLRFRPDEELLQRADRIRMAKGFWEPGKMPGGVYQNRMDGRFGKLRGFWTTTCPYETAPAATPVADTGVRIPPTALTRPIAPPPVAAAALPPPPLPPPAPAQNPVPEVLHTPDSMRADTMRASGGAGLVAPATTNGVAVPNDNPNPVPNPPGYENGIRRAVEGPPPAPPPDVHPEPPPQIEPGRENFVPPAPAADGGAATGP